MFEKYQSDNTIKNSLSYKICQNYFVSKTTSDLFYYLSALITYVINCLFIGVSDWLVKAICCTDQITERQIIGILCFLCLYFNTVIVSILVNSSFIEYGENSIINGIFHIGRNTDFGSTWYHDLGVLIWINLIILGFKPIDSLFFEAVKAKF